MIVPAGVSHRLLDVLDGGFKMVGSYPPGLEWDTVLPIVAMTRQGPILGMRGGWTGILCTAIPTCCGSGLGVRSSGLVGTVCKFGKLVVVEF